MSRSESEVAPEPRIHRIYRESLGPMKALVDGRKNVCPTGQLGKHLTRCRSRKRVFALHPEALRVFTSLVSPSPCATGVIVHKVLFLSLFLVLMHDSHFLFGLKYLPPAVLLEYTR